MSAIDRALDTLVVRQFAVRPGTVVLITADEASDRILVDRLSARACEAGAVASVLDLPRLPLQGLLADPHIPPDAAAAFGACDVWFDLTFPYLAGSTPFARAMENGRTRYLLLGDVRLDGLARLYGSVDYDALFDLQEEADRMLRDAQGQWGRITTPLGTDIEFRIGKPATRKTRQAIGPGAQTVPGSAIFYPEVETVRGTIALEAAFHDHYERLSRPLLLEIDGRIRRVGPGPCREPMERALRRAGGGEFGQVIHLTIGLNPMAADQGQSFIEDIRAVGRNAIGLGLPWWVPGGGENHPDGIVTRQSLWLAGQPVLADGRPVAGHPLAALLAAVEASTTHAPIQNQEEPHA
ncbi:hypothetical protein H4CHR_04221 [Variovorax sp. PBS-H4]|uniref:hypothetical protein n=1 Tax=Variovorax sp. PBS-H4 TaxID=434008 RepID=UPI001316A0EF|nr:hypothetical protein [Variovorax sp. PBS-H4]VTU37636.1 hypothetical protein H4CHR_04221 [Variovorax sp. PBS-H4]